MSRIRLGPGWDRLILIPACVLPVLLIFYSKDVSLSAAFHSSAIFKSVTAVMIAIAAMSAAQAIWAPALVIDERGIAFEWIAGGWSIGWGDVEDIGVYVAPRGSQFLAIRARDGSPAQSSMKRTIYGGYDRLIPKNWGTSIEDINRMIANYWPAPVSRPGQSRLEASQQTGFGRRSGSVDTGAHGPGAKITGFPIVTLALKLRVILFLWCLFLLFAAYLAVHAREPKDSAARGHGQVPATTPLVP